MARKRIALSIDPEYHEILVQIANYQNKTVTSVVTDFLNASRPSAELMLKAFEDLKAGKPKEDVLTELFASGLEIASKEMKK